MSGPEIAILLLFEAVCGAAGAMAVARLWRGIGFGWKSIAAIGALGGLILTLLATLFPGLARFVGYMGGAFDALSRGSGGFTLEILIGVGVAGLLGGIIAICIARLARGTNSSPR
ncbi:hypothetical protein MesoLj113c_61700 [Mesorhizobium sp. 113-3-9]|uniref:hypothetical protein n=1 Tax=Mesorhizobium sp. 113-3-9 TaxID=2744517 RepID=UPI001927D2BD|nr:hypothetical protein [Mesorhizobium sp. 113-3-9]BCG90060.1 hypothetical protein MesoLj113c_61700 [Mesorhizobium sp. 113-3-9]